MGDTLRVAQALICFTMNHIPIKIRKAVQQRIAKQVTKVITGLLSDLLLVNFTSVIHASFGMFN